MTSSSTTLPDHELVELARRGDRGAFEALIRRHDVRMRGLAYRLLADRQVMDDVLHDAYLNAYRGLERFKPGRDVGQWLYRATYNACVDELRRRRRRPLTAADAIDPPSAPPEGDQARSAAETVRAALAALPPDQRVAVVLVDGEGFEQRAVAGILGVAEDRIEPRLLRARATLRRVLGEQVR